MKKLLHSLCFLLLAPAGYLSSFAQGGDTGGGIQFTSSSSPAAIIFQSALQLHDVGEGTKAREQLLKATAQDPRLAIAYLYLTNHATSPREFVSFLAKAKENLAAANEWEKLYYDYQETFLKDDLNQRLAIAQKMVSQFDGKARAYVQLAAAYAALNDVPNERENLQRAIALEPSWPGAYPDLVNSFLFQAPKDFAQAQQVAEKFVAAAPAYGFPHILLGDVYRAQNNLAKAEGEYSKVVAMNPTQAMVFYKRGHVNSFLGNYQQAKADYEKAGTLDVVPTGARNFIAFTYLYEGQPQKALQSLLADVNNAAKGMDRAKAATAKYNFLQEAALIAVHMRDANALQDVVAQLQPVSEEMGNQIGTDEAMRNYKAGVLLFESILKAMNRDVAGAKQTAEEMKTVVDPINNPRKYEDYDFASGYLSLLQKDFRDAVLHFEKVNKANVYGQYCLAKAYEGMGEKEKAAAIYKDLVNYNFNEIGYALIRNELKKKK